MLFSGNNDVNKAMYKFWHNFTPTKLYVRHKLHDTYYKKDSKEMPEITDIYPAKAIKLQNLSVMSIIE